MGFAKFLAALAAVCCLIAASCGSGKSTRFEPAGNSLAELARPADVDPQLWEELKAALAKSIAEHAGTRGASEVPQIPQSKITDFALLGMDSEGAHFSWSYRSQGDYDQNGEVNVSDLSPLGSNFGKTSADADWAKALPADGNGDGAITIADVTPIGANLRILLDGFVIQQSATPTDEGSWVDVLDVLLAEGVIPAGGGVRQYNTAVANPIGNSHYRVRAFQGIVPSRLYGIPSDSAMTADFQPPTGVSATLGQYADKVVVAWDAAVDAIGYEVYRDVQDTAVATTDAATLSWDDTGLADFLPHTYWVKAVYAAGTSPFSVEAVGSRAQRGDWWMYGRDARHSHRASIDGPQDNALFWGKKHAGASFSGSSPAFGADGTIYIGSYDDSKLYALNPDGSVQWTFTADSGSNASPAVGADGTIYFATSGFSGSALYAITPQGDEKWTFPLPFGAFSSPAISSNGDIFIGGIDGLLYAIRANGTLRWGKPLSAGTLVFGSPAVDSAGNVYVADYDGVIFKLDSEGNEVWDFPTGTSIMGSPSLSDDEEVVYIADILGKIYAINTGSGKDRWIYPTGGFGFSESAAIAADGSIFIGDNGGTMWKINSNGTLGWSKSLGADGLNSPALGADGKIYVGSYESAVFALEPSAGAIAWQRPTESVPTSVSIGPGGKLYTGTFGGYVLCFGPGNSNAPGTPTGLTATQGSLYQAIKLNWDFAYDAEGYEVYRDGSASPVATLGNVTQWLDKPVADSSPHSYTIKALNSSGVSAASAPATGSASNNPPGPGDWSMFGRDAARTRRSPLNGPADQPTFWSFQTSGAIYSSPTVGANGEIYVGSDDGSLYCLASDGSEIWSKPMGSPVESSVAIGSDGTLYFGTGSGTFYALNPDSSEKWNYPTGANIYSSPAIDNGKIYFGNMAGELFALNPDGSLDWSYDVGLMIVSSPAIGSDGRIYVGNGEDDELVAVLPDGSDVAWRFPAGGSVRATPTVKRDAVNGDKIYVGTMSNRMYCINAAGTEDWHYDATGFIFSSAALGADGAIYFGSEDGFVYALESDGDERWTSNMFAPVYSSPLVAADGRVFVGDASGFLNAITTVGTFDWYVSLAGSVADTSPALGPGGMAYIADEAGFIYGFQP